MTEKRYDLIYEKEPRGQVVTDNGIPCTARTCCTRLNHFEDENKELNAKNKVLHKEIERLKTQNEDILYNNAKNMELLEKENEQFRKGIIDCLFKGESLQIFAEKMGLIE